MITEKYKIAAFLIFRLINLAILPKQQKVSSCKDNT